MPIPTVTHTTDRSKIVAHYLQQIENPDFQIAQIRRDLEGNNFDEEEIRTIVRLVDSELQRRLLATTRKRKAGDLVYIGGILTAIGAGITIATYTGLIDMGDSFLIIYGPFLGGLSILFAALTQKSKGREKGPPTRGIKRKM